jgi:hypothetical protein
LRGHKASLRGNVVRRAYQYAALALVLTKAIGGPVAGIHVQTFQSRPLPRLRTVDDGRRSTIPLAARQGVPSTSAAVGLHLSLMGGRCKLLKTDDT